MSETIGEKLNHVNRFTASAEAAPVAADSTRVTYQLLEEEPDKIENWLQRNPENYKGVTRFLSLASVNDKYAEKAETYKWTPDFRVLANEKIEGRNRVSFKHVTFPRVEIGLTYYGNAMIDKMVRVTDVFAAKLIKPVIMQPSVELELTNGSILDDAYDETKLMEGYEANQKVNTRLQLIIEEEIETMLDDQGFFFSANGKSYSTRCGKCNCVPCVWRSNELSMIGYDKAENDDKTKPNKCRHQLYGQMALIINGGPTGYGIRLKLPVCVVDGIRELFPDPDAVYVGHKEKE
jgi:hypothetical protein